MSDKAIRAAKLTAAGILDKARARVAVDRAGGQIAPSKYLPDVPRQVHAYGGRANERNDIWWHGSPSGDLRGGTSGLHLGTKEAALDALRARIGVPADGSMWDGTKEYGKTLLAGQNTLNRMGKYLITGHNVRAPKEDYYPHQHPKGMPTVGAGVPVDPTWKPFLRPFKIVGPMTNSPYRPHSDSRANAMMQASLTKGNAKSGYYYTNEGEDSGSISAVVPNGSHVAPVEDPAVVTRATGGRTGMAYGGGYVPTSFAQPPHQLVVARVARPVQQQQGPSTLDSLTQLAELAYGKPPEAKVESPSAATEGHSPEAVAAGMSARAQEAMNALRKGWTGQAFDIESAYRDPTQNQAVGGAKGSQHLHGNAYDIDTTGWTPEQKLALATEAYNAGFRGFGFYGNNLHFDVGAQRAWGPSYHRESIPDWAQPWTQQYLGYASGGAAMFEGIHPDLQDEQGNPKDLWHGTPGEPFDEFKDEKIGRRDPGFYGRGHYLTAQRGNAEAYADPEEMQRGSVMGPLHAALKNPFVWDASSPESLHRTMRKLQDFGVMGGKDRLDPWDALKPHEIDQFMKSAVANGHDGVIRKTGRGLSEIVVFKPSAIKHRDAERFDPNDPNIYHARGGVAK